ncbi:MAG: hypothetical protein QOJ37_2834 [Pseudonocardiales bacterium]|nr:hypothetical protein [Pseudonocardiales bacterium]
MRSDPLARLSTELRLAAAAVLCIAPMGLLWSVSTRPGHNTLVSQSPLRVFLLFAAATLAFVAIRVRTAATRRIARAGTVSIGIAAVLAAANGRSLVLVCLLAAAALTVGPVWARPARTGASGGVFVPGQLRR